VQKIHSGSNKGELIATDRRPLRHVARFILLGLYTGTRASAIASASPIQTEGRSFIDLHRKIFYRKAVGKRSTNKRQPPVQLPDRLVSHLRRWTRLGLFKECFVEFNGKPVASVKKGFAHAVKLAKLSGTVTPHVLRHTAATWLMQRGVSIFQAAGFLGMSIETLEKHYAHHHPEHMAAAAAAITSKPKPYPVVETVVDLARVREKRLKGQ
jgi:integrase